MSERTFYRTWALWQQTGDVVTPKTGTRGRPRLMLREDLQYLLKLIRANPTYFLDELLDLTRKNRFISVHFTTIFNELKRLRVSRKKLRRIAAERDELARAAYVGRMAQYLPEELGFIDEVSKDERTLGRHYGRALMGLRAEAEQPFVRGTRFTACSLLTIDGISATKVVEGSMTKVMYLEFLEQLVLPNCSAYPGPCSVLVMDNAKIHHGEEMQELVDRFGVRIEYLPAYSPDLNPIEEAFSKIKHFLRRHGQYYAEADEEAKRWDLYEVMDIITDIDACGYFLHAGYF
ncbi:unnamed protein product [Peniophora sp. CBMAI 1063]|nr:unnamed protein product [Peniophora sp. CBMAI 1063]